MYHILNGNPCKYRIYEYILCQLIKCPFDMSIVGAITSDLDNRIFAYGITNMQL